ncbi:MAG: hypothetical protein A2735_01230 [Candidatus Yanofskybacteria bacterium RIFCSPHIGHO2_01_FULL_41_21]|uniref:Uncharacterized protein n=1 Tax=Candidatus Yanofskybacteria bacterium RIFCSPHIGHO2_01_FULL_41_21 TaxID=1802660 RepID=A0A1F8EAC1_9BACT|nr:MAG: hypothetical protein A2735_01230 [Candidatus Yanofskybacteria bacterium RIFCSPHIGHO2_01_FULL_41_21]
MTYTTFKKYAPKKPVHKFTDLEVYQQTLALSVIIMKDLKPKLIILEYPFLENLTNGAISLPLWIAEAHSVRFGDHAVGLGLLEKVMSGCNKMVVYLEQAKGIYRPAAEVASSLRSRDLSQVGQSDDQRSATNKIGTGALDPDLIDDLIKRYHDVRTKVFRLSKSWQKWYDVPLPKLPSIEKREQRDKINI